MRRVLHHNHLSSWRPWLQLGVSVAPDMAAAFEEQVLVKLEAFLPQNVSNTVWALATLGLAQQPGVLSYLAHKFKAQLP